MPWAQFPIPVINFLHLNEKLNQQFISYIAMTTTEDNCYQNEGYVESEPGCSTTLPTPSPDDPCSLVTVTVHETDPPTKPPSSPTFSCKTQMSSLSLDMPICRICQDSRDKERLVSPCGCSGSSKFVHRRCLLKWIMLKGAEECEICQKPYDKKITHGSFFSPTQENTIASSIVVLLLLLGVTGVGIYLLVDHLSSYRGNHGVSIWIPISLLCVGMLGLSVFLPWLALFCLRIGRRHNGRAPLTQNEVPIHQLHI